MAAVIILLILHLLLQFRQHSIGQVTRLELGILSADLSYWFDLDNERKVGAIFGTSLLLFSALTMVTAAVISRHQKTTAIGWILFSSVLLYMASDEFFRLHERSGDLFFGNEGGFGEHMIPAWVRIFAVVTVLLCIPMGYFWWKLPLALRIRLAVGGAVFLTGAMGVEIISSTYVMSNGRENFPYAVLVAVEEGLEMIGVLIVIDAMLMHLTGLIRQSDEVEPVRNPHQPYSTR